VDPSEGREWIAQSHGFAVAALTRKVRLEIGLP
jgi:hypothetical protein